MIITITFTLLDLLILHRYLHVWLDSTLAWLSDHPAAGGVAFVGVFLIGSLCFFPVALLTLGAGYVYIDLYGLRLGIVVAFVVCYFGCLIGAAVCFARSRYLMRQLIIKFSDKYPIVRAVDRAFETKGLRLFLLLRLSSMPFNALNYIGGITSIKFRDYWWATCAGTIPSLLWTIFVGATFGTIDTKGVDGHKEFESTAVRKGVVLGLGIGLGVMGLIGTTIYARKGPFVSGLLIATPWETTQYVFSVAPILNRVDKNCVGGAETTSPGRTNWCGTIAASDRWGIQS